MDPDSLGSSSLGNFFRVVGDGGEAFSSYFFFQFCRLVPMERIGFVADPLNDINSH